MLIDKSFHPRLETLPVFRHGSEAVRICDESLSVTGPNDQRISRIIQSDHNAQMAFHIHKALGYALDVGDESMVLKLISCARNTRNTQ